MGNPKFANESNIKKGESRVFDHFPRVTLLV